MSRPKWKQKQLKCFINRLEFVCLFSWRRLGQEIGMEKTKTKIPAKNKRSNKFWWKAQAGKILIKMAVGRGGEETWLILCIRGLNKKIRTRSQAREQGLEGAMMMMTSGAMSDRSASRKYAKVHKDIAYPKQYDIRLLCAGHRYLRAGLSHQMKIGKPGRKAAHTHWRSLGCVWGNLCICHKIIYQLENF